jgi:hypothetical protein
VTRPPMDENDLARFLEARGLTEAERGAAVAHLSESDPDAELLADAAYMLRELEADEGVIPLRRPEPRHLHVDDVDKGTDTPPAPSRPPSMQRARPRRIPARWLALAAMLAGVLLVPLALSRSRGHGDELADITVLVTGSAGLPVGWTDQRRPWSVSRGGGDVLIDNARAARLGALHMDLEFAAAGGQAEQTGLLASQIAGMLDDSDIPAASFAASPYRRIAAEAAGSPQALAPLLAEGGEAVESLVDGDAFVLGAWAEGARIAARQHGAAFFRTAASRQMIERAGDLSSLDPATRASIDALRAASRAEGEPDWAALEAHADQLLRHLAD